MTDEEIEGFDPAGKEILRYMRRSANPLPGEFQFTPPMPTHLKPDNIFWLVPDGIRIPVKTVGYNKLEGAERICFLKCVTRDVIVLEVQHRDQSAPHKTYHEPFETLYGERITDDGDWGMAIDESQLPKILTLARAKVPQLVFPSLEGKGETVK